MRKTPLLSRSLLGAGLLAASLSAQATVINFDNTAPAGSSTAYTTATGYSEAGFTVKATSGTLSSIDPTFAIFGGVSQNGTDYGAIENPPSGGLGTTQSFRLTESTNAAFSLNSLYLVDLADGVGGASVTLTGNLAAGGTVSQVFTTPLSFIFSSLLTLGSNWTGLSSVDFVSIDHNFGFDSITVNGAASAVPVPPSVWLLGAGMLGLLGLRRRRV